VHRLPDHSLLVLVDTREKRPYHFKADRIETAAAALAAGDYGVRVNGQLIAAVERKTLDGFRNALSDGSLAFAMAHLSTLRAAAVVVEATYADVLRSKFTAPGWMDELIARLQARYPSVPIVFADSRKLAEHWTARFLAAVAAEFSAPGLPLDQPPQT
jgi:ERCC4-type nuclease